MMGKRRGNEASIEKRQGEETGTKGRKETIGCKEKEKRKRGE